MQNQGMNGCSSTKLQGLGAYPVGFRDGGPCYGPAGSPQSSSIVFFDGSSLCVPDSILKGQFGADAFSPPTWTQAQGQQAAGDAFAALANIQMQRSQTLPNGYTITKACIPGVEGSIGGQTGFWSLYGPDGKQQCLTLDQLNKFAPGSAAQQQAAAQGLQTNTGPVAAQAAAQVAAANQLAISQSPQYAASSPVSMLTPAQLADPAVIAARQQQQAAQAQFAAMEQQAATQNAAQLAATQQAMSQAIAAFQAANPNSPVPGVSTMTTGATTAQPASGFSLDSITAWIQQNPLLAAGGAAAALFLFMGGKH